jgi:NADPH:quinone reductase-like Zn-dependent oxidoreductase
MQRSVPETMKAVAIDQFGGPEVLQVKSLPVPTPKDDEVLLELDTAGIGVWDPFVREGELELGPHSFPFVIGNDGAGRVVAVGKNAKRFRVGDRVYAYALEGGFYAQYIAVKESNVAPVPSGVKTDAAGVLGADGTTGLRGLDDQLHLKAGQTLMIFGASGGIGHIAVQLAKRIGAEVLAVASGKDGVELVRRLGADNAIDGHRDDVPAAVREFAPDGLDAALVLVSGERLNEALRLMKPGSRVAHPNGVEPVPEVPKGVSLIGYDGTPGNDAFERLNALIGSAPFHVELGRVYSLDEAARAHRELNKHHLGKLALRLRAA